MGIMQLQYVRNVGWGNLNYNDLRKNWTKGLLMSENTINSNQLLTEKRENIQREKTYLPNFKIKLLQFGCIYPGIKIVILSS